MPHQVKRNSTVAPSKARQHPPAMNNRNHTSEGGRDELAKGNKPLLITDPLRPHTRAAQAMRPYDAPLPSYVLSMNQAAVHAGLEVRCLLKCRSRKYGDQILLAYSGMQEQIRNCDLVACPDTIRWPDEGHKATRFDISWMFPFPQWYAPYGHVHRLGQMLYSIAIELELPIKTSTPFADVEHFQFAEGCGYSAHIGRKTALLGAGIAEASMFPDCSEGEGATSDDEIFPATRTRFLRGGIWACIERRKDRRPRMDTTDMPLSDYRTPDEYRKELAKNVWALATVALHNRSSEVQTKQGFLYRLTPEARERAEGLISDLYHDLCEQLDVSATPIDVRPESERRRAAELATRAQTDTAFKGFMHDLMSHIDTHGGRK